MSTEPQVYFQDRWEGVDQTSEAFYAPENIPPSKLRASRGLMANKTGELIQPFSAHAIVFSNAGVAWDAATEYIYAWFTHRGEVYGHVAPTNVMATYTIAPGAVLTKTAQTILRTFDSFCDFIHAAAWVVILADATGKLRYMDVEGGGNDTEIATSPEPARGPFVHGNCLWCLTNAAGIVDGPSDRLVFSAVDDPTTWPAGNYIAVEPEGAPIVKCFSTGTAILIFKEDSIWLYRGVGGVTTDTLTKVANFGAPEPDMIAEGKDAFYAVLHSGEVVAITKSGQAMPIGVAAASAPSAIDRGIRASKVGDWAWLNAENWAAKIAGWQVCRQFSAATAGSSTPPRQLIFMPTSVFHAVERTREIALEASSTPGVAVRYCTKQTARNEVDFPGRVAIESGQLFFENDQTGRFDHKRLSRVWLGVHNFVNTGTSPVCKIEFFADYFNAFAEIDFVAADFLSGVEKWKHIPNASTVAARSYRWKITVTPGTGGKTDFGLSAIAIEFTNLGVQ